MQRYFFDCKLFSVGSQEEPDLEIQAFKICDTNKDDALTWQEVEDCEVCILILNPHDLLEPSFFQDPFPYRRSIANW